MGLITELLEPSFFDVATAIAQAAELPELKRRHWICSVRQIARWLDRPAALIPARIGAVEARLRQIHHARVGTTLKTLANHKANGRAALRWFAKQHNIPQHGMVLSSDWVAFRNEIGESARNRLSNFIRYCSARGIEPNGLSGRTKGPSAFCHGLRCDLRIAACRAIHSSGWGTSPGSRRSSGTSPS